MTRLCRGFMHITNILFTYEECCGLDNYICNGTTNMKSYLTKKTKNVNGHI